MKNRGLSIAFAVAAVAVVAAFPAPAFAQLAPAYTNNFEQASDIQGWDNYSYPYDVVWAVDDTPIGGHNSSNSLNFNNGTDYDGDYPYGDIYNYSSPIDTSGMNDPVVSFWCYYDLTSDSGTPDHRLLGLWEPNYSAFYYWELSGDGSSNWGYPAETCAGLGTWHQHMISIPS